MFSNGKRRAYLKDLSAEKSAISESVNVKSNGIMIKNSLIAFLDLTGKYTNVRIW